MRVSRSFSMRRPRSVSSAFAVFLLAMQLVACAGARLYAPTAALQGLYVRPYMVEQHHGEVSVKTVIENHTDKIVRIDRDGFVLRLRDGRRLSRPDSIFTRHNVYNVPP